MIDQIDIEKTLQLQPNKECLFVSVATILNHVVDVVNELQEMCKSCDNQIGILAEQIAKLQHDNSEKANCHENVQDKFAEQCKWLGKLCKFWDGDKQMSHLCWGILYTITPTSPVPYCCSLGDGITSDYEHCEPVLPTDNAIYKGGNNE